MRSAISRRLLDMKGNHAQTHVTQVVAEAEREALIFTWL